jgi:hypothetical protein
MRRLGLTLLVFVVVGFAQAFAQGLIPDSPEDIAAARPAPAFRGVLPKQVDLSNLLPPPRTQWLSMTCVSWAATYVAASEARRRASPDHRLEPLSPSFTYALAGGTPNCRRPTSIIRTLEVLRTIGALPLNDYAFDVFDCGRSPTAMELSRATRWRIAGWYRVTAHDLDTVKGQLAGGHPIIFGMDVGPQFEAHRGDAVFTAVDIGPRVAGHAMVLVGYDDTRLAFRLQNSYGPDWGDHGYAWIGYTTWQKAVHQDTGFAIE